MISSLQLGNLVIAHRYVVGSNLRQGSYSELYRVFDRKEQCTVILKALNTRLRGVPDQLLEETLVDNFKQEARVLNLVRHPHIVELLDEGVGVNDAGLSFRYLVLEYLAGGDLQSHCSSNPLSLVDALRYFEQVVSALATAHAREIVHRDLKPANFLLSANRKNIKVADFGVARLIGRGQGRLITRVGTAIYSPPEHNPELGRNTQILTPASDIYSLAKTLYATLSGQAPIEFKARQIDTLPPVLSVQPWAPGLLMVLRRATADNVDQRYQSVSEFWQDFSKAVSRRGGDLKGDVEELEASDLENLKVEPATIELPSRRSRLVIDLLPLKARTLELITVSAEGKIVTRSSGRASYFVEEIGNGVNIEMIRIPGGQYQMGSSASESERTACEGPLHRVNVASFLLGAFQVTQQQWRRVSEFRPVEIDLDSEPSTFKGGGLPVESISWHEAVEFCARLSRSTGRRYRLPSEAEWEYACRAGSTTPFHFGENILPGLANYDTMLPYKNAPSCLARNQTAPVHQLADPNELGVMGMHGNVWEWCADTWHENYVGAMTGGLAWRRKGDDGLLVVRGGSWFNPAWLCRSAYRYAFDGHTKRADVGFRLAAEL